MVIWIDAQLSPSLALWINQNYDDISACSLRSLGLRDVGDRLIFQKAKDEKAVIMSKDTDFIKLQEQFGPPPQIIWVTAGNTSNTAMRSLLKKHFNVIIKMLVAGEPLIEIEG
jgi:predicted nuclease of predicted toxin-antitoxin system